MTAHEIDDLRLKTRKLYSTVRTFRQQAATMDAETMNNVCELLQTYAAELMHKAAQ